MAHWWALIRTKLNTAYTQFLENHNMFHQDKHFNVIGENHTFVYIDNIISYIKRKCSTYLQLPKSGKLVQEV